MLLDAELRIYPAEGIRNTLRDIHRTENVSCKNLQRIDVDSVATGMDFYGLNPLDESSGAESFANPCP